MDGGRHTREKSTDRREHQEYANKRTSEVGADGWMKGGREVLTDGGRDERVKSTGRTKPQEYANKTALQGDVDG